MGMEAISLQTYLSKEAGMLIMMACENISMLALESVRNWFPWPQLDIKGVCQYMKETKICI